MPGLLGIISEDKIDEQLLNRMINSIKHEEWYRTDKYIGPYFGVARVHLGIFNPEPQPLFNEDKTICIFMDGKIYGYEKEMEELKLGHRFNFDNDTEFCLHAYEEYGEDFVRELNGSFVLLIYDLAEKKLLIANDRYGSRVQYYAMNNNRLLFSPEAKAVLQDGTFKKELDDEAVAQFFAFGELWGDKTFFKGVQVLPPASILIYGKGVLSIRQYWHVSYQPDYSCSEEEVVEQLIEAIKRAAEIRMKDNLRYGISLSGGLDSRVVLAALVPEQGKNIVTYSFGPLHCDEVKIAKEVSRKYGAKHRHIEITPDLIIKNAEHEIWLSDGRDYVGLSYIHPVHKAISNYVDIFLDGFALDFTLGGSYLNKKRLRCESDKQLFQEISKRRLFSEGELSRLFVPRYYRDIKDVPFKSLKRELDKLIATFSGNKFDEFIWHTHLSWFVTGYILVRDVIEVSHPTADNNFLDIVFRIPPEWRLNHYVYRKFLKRLSSDLARIPYNKTMVSASAPLIFWKAGVIYQFINEMAKKLLWRISKGKVLLSNKRGYVNFDEWLRTDKIWKIYFKELLVSKDVTLKEYLNQDYIKYLFQQHEVGRKDNSLKILYLATFELFLRQFMIS